MAYRTIVIVAAVLFCAMAGAVNKAGADVIEVGVPPITSGSGQLTLSEALERANPGDTLRLLPGRHRGPVSIDKSLTLVGVGAGAVIEGTGSGSVVTVKAPDVRIEGLTVTGSGLLLETQDTGIFLSKEARKAQVLNNQVLDNLIGVYVWGAKDALVKGNTVEGRRDLRVNERGNGIQLWNAPGTRVENNTIRYGRDGIFVTTSKHNHFTGNLMEDLRFAVHYMYTNASSVRGNISRRNHLGFAIMFSKKIEVEDNLSHFDRDRGILFNYANKVRVRGNVVVGGPEKCVFIYNSNKNEISGNLFSRCAIGIHFTGGSERNRLFGNAFVGNRTQVKYVGTRWVEWSHEGRGNYWSDHTAFDLNRDGIADAAYRPNDLTDQILWRFPAAKLLANSPAIQVLKWAQSSFPALHPGGVIDSKPLMTVPAHLHNHLEPNS